MRIPAGILLFRLGVVPVVLLLIVYTEGFIHLSQPHFPIDILDLSLSLPAMLSSKNPWYLVPLLHRVLLFAFSGLHFRHL